jgi:hypothetical protein
MVTSSLSCHPERLRKGGCGLGWDIGPARSRSHGEGAVHRRRSDAGGSGRREGGVRTGWLPCHGQGGLTWPLPGERPWGVVFSVTVPMPVFFAAFATEGANDPYPPVRAWAQEIFEARRGSRLRRGKILIYGRPGASSSGTTCPRRRSTLLPRSTGVVSAILWQRVSRWTS